MGHPLVPCISSYFTNRSMPRVIQPSAAGLVPAGLSEVAETGQECGETPSLSKKPGSPGCLDRVPCSLSRMLGSES